MFFQLFFFKSTTLLTGMTGISFHLQWPMTSQSHGSVSQREQLNDGICLLQGLTALNSCTADALHGMLLVLQLLQGLAEQPCRDNCEDDSFSGQESRLSRHHDLRPGELVSSFSSVFEKQHSGRKAETPLLS
jgi:hypothetical protein